MHLNPPYRGCRLSTSTSTAIPKSRRLFLVIGASAIVLFGKSDLKALAQETAPAATPSTRMQRSTRSTAVQTQQTLWVNPETGNDAKADGTEQAPFRTLTRALEAARSNTVIQLASGTYSTDIGEIFPIALKSGVTVQGNADGLGQGVVIRGGGSYSSSTAGNQNVTLVGVSQATLTGVTVTNPNVRGHGLWVETGRPTVRDNTFISNINTGLVTAGSSAPLVQNNLFLLNRSSGMMITGSAQPQVQNNIFQRTGTGITISENAAPQLANNRISQNRDGIVVQGNARPILRSNMVEDNQRDGLVVIAQAQPNLGTAKDPGNNTFLNNRQHDINALTTSQTLPAFGNQLNDTQIAGKVDLTGNAPLVSVATVASAADRLPATQVTRLTSTRPPTTSRQPMQPASAQSASAQSASTQLNQTAPITQPPPLISSLPPTNSSPSVSTSGSTASGSTASSSTASSSTASSSRTARPSRSATQPTTTATTASTRSSRSAAQPTTTATTATTASTRSTRSTQTATRTTSRSTQPAAIDLNVPPPERSTSASTNPNLTSTRSGNLIPRRSVANPTPAPATPPSSSIPQAIAIAVPPPETTTQSVPPAIPQFANVTVTAAASLPRQFFAGTNPATPALGGTPINIPVPPPAPRQTTPSTASPGSVSLLPVPPDEIPVGNTEGVSRVNVAGGQGGGLLLASQRESLQYRVVVEADDEQVQSLVQSLVPGAFVTSVNGQSVMQIGAFSNQDNAQEAIEMLSRNGLRGIIQPIE